MPPHENRNEAWLKLHNAKGNGNMTETKLRIANRLRQKEWDTGNQLTLDFRVTELGGEIGEALNCIKKVQRERLGIKGSRATMADVADELADVIICVDLIGMHLDLPAIEYVQAASAPNTKALTFLGRKLLACAGQVALSTEMFERGHIGADTVRTALVDLQGIAILLFASLRIDVEAAVRRKFNLTSVNNKLNTRIGV